MTTKVFILGAGYAGIEAALTLSKKQHPSDNLEISLINKNLVHTMITDLHKVAANKHPEESITIPLSDIFKNTKVKIIRDAITDIDLSNNALTSENSTYAYDYLIVATGSKPNFYKIPGMEQNCFPFWFLKDAVKIREHIKHCFKKAAETKNPEEKKALLSFVIGGGGFTGVEIIGELALWIGKLCKQHNLPRDLIKLYLVDALPTIISAMKTKNINTTTRYLTQKLGVEILTNSCITKVDANSVELKNGKKIMTKTLIWTAGIQGACTGVSINSDSRKGCRIPVNEYMQTQHNKIYAIGDVAAYAFKQTTLPPMVEPAMQMAKISALNILAQIRGEGLTTYIPNLHGAMVSAGSYFAVSEIMGIQPPVICSIFLKHLINVHYIYGIAGVSGALKYIKEEIFSLF